MNLHDSSAEPTKLIIEEVDLVNLQVRPMPHPVHIWEGGPLICNSKQNYEALYNGQINGALLADHVNTDYLTHNPGTFPLSPGETDTMAVHVVSRIEADIVFSVQVIYHLSTDQQLHTLRLSNLFEVLFVDTHDWQLYQFKDGHFIINS